MRGMQLPCQGLGGLLTTEYRMAQLLRGCCQTISATRSNSATNPLSGTHSRISTSTRTVRLFTSLKTSSPGRGFQTCQAQLVSHNSSSSVPLQSLHIVLFTNLFAGFMPMTRKSTNSSVQVNATWQCMLSRPDPGKSCGQRLWGHPTKCLPVSLTM